MALLERAHVQAFDYPSVDDQMAGSNYPRRVDMRVPWVTFYRRPWEAIQYEQAALFLGGASEAVSWPWGEWIDPAYTTNLLDRVNSLTNPSIYVSNVKDIFPIGGGSSETSQWFDVYAAYDIPTNYATWVPANLAWVENLKRAHIETNSFMTWTTNGEVVSTAIWTNAPIAAGRHSTDYGLDALRPLISATRHSGTEARFAITNWVSGLGGSTNSYAEAIANALAAPVDEMVSGGYTGIVDSRAGWCATLYTNNSGDYVAYYEWQIGRLYCGALPDGFKNIDSSYMQYGVPPSDEMAKSGEVYAQLLTSLDDFDRPFTTNAYVLLESIPAQTNAVMEGAVYGRPVVAGDFPPSAGTISEVYQTSFGVLDYGVTNGFIYK
jgi:hypothetical protein